MVRFAKHHAQIMKSVLNMQQLLPRVVRASGCKAAKALTSCTVLSAGGPGVRHVLCFSRGKAPGQLLRAALV